MKINARFDAELKALQQALEDMMSLGLDGLRAIAGALEEGKVAGVARVGEIAQEIDRAERNIESLCLRILLTRHPVASDRRRVSGTLKMITDLQRIGHQCRDFADILSADGEKLETYLVRLSQIADQVVEMFEGAMSACVHGDTVTAREIVRSDNEVDAAYAVLRSSLAEELRGSSHPNADRLLDVLMLAKYLERMADHIVLFARWIIFAANGERDLPNEEGAEEDQDWNNHEEEK